MIPHTGSLNGCVLTFLVGGLFKAKPSSLPASAACEHYIPFMCGTVLEDRYVLFFHLVSVGFSIPTTIGTDIMSQKVNN